MFVDLLPRRFVIYLLLVSALAASAQTAGWTQVSPGFSAEVLVHHGKGMWAAGSENSIAFSNDRGRHWQIKHTEPGGGLLLAFGFVGESFGYAAGTGSHLLLTTDAGETWTSAVTVPDPVFQATFGDPQHGLIRTRTALLCTADGGKNWTAVKLATNPDWPSKYPYTIQLAALDGDRLAVQVSKGQYSDSEFISTRDGGKTWTETYLPNGAGGHGLFVAGDQYWSVGGEVVGKDKPGGGLRVPMAVRSKDGLDWEHLPVLRDACHWSECSGCTAQGCFAGRRSFVPFSRILEPGDRKQSDDERLYHLPEQVLSSEWAREGDRICILLRGTVHCAGLTAVQKLDTRDDSAQWQNESFPPLSMPRGSFLNSVSIEPALKGGVRCIRCNLDQLFISSERKTGPADVEIKFTVEASGRVADATILGDIPSEIRDKLSDSARDWLFVPYIQNGQTRTVLIDLHARVMIMHPPAR